MYIYNDIYCIFYSDSVSADMAPRGACDSPLNSALTHGRGDRRLSPTSTRHNIKLPSACPHPLATLPYDTSGLAELSIDARPVLPTVAGTNADSNDRSVGATGARERIAIDEYKAYARNNSRVNKKKHGKRMQNTAKLDSDRPSTAPNCARVTDDSETRHSHSATSWRGRNMESMCGRTGNVTESEHGVTNSEHDCARRDIKPSATTYTQTTTTNTISATSTTTSKTESDPGVHCVQSGGIFQGNHK